MPTEKSSRRNFLSNLLFGVGFGGSAFLFIRHIIAYVFPKIEPKKFRKILVAREGEVKVGEVKPLVINGKELYLVHTPEKYIVVSAVCTHLGCKVRWEQHRERFYCPCHKAIFDMMGNVIEGPPPRPLDQYEVEVEKKFVYMWYA